jgi:hypothetical protein
MKLTCYAVALVVLLGGGVQMVRTHLNTPQLVFCPDLVGCVPVTEVQWVAADADAHAPVMRAIPETVR